MSWETLLVGNVLFKPDLKYDKLEKPTKLICEYSECDVPKNIENNDEYTKEFDKRRNGAHMLLYNLESNHTQYELRINDVNWSSHMCEEKMNALKHIIAYYKDLISESGMSLYYLTDPDDNFFLEQDDNDTIEEFKHSDVGEYYDDLVEQGILTDDEDNDGD